MCVAPPWQQKIKCTRWCWQERFSTVWMRSPTRQRQERGESRCNIWTKIRWGIATSELLFCRCLVCMGDLTYIHPEYHTTQWCISCNNGREVNMSSHLKREFSPKKAGNRRPACWIQYFVVRLDDLPVRSQIRRDERVHDIMRGVSEYRADAMVSLSFFSDLLLWRIRIQGWCRGFEWVLAGTQKTAGLQITRLVGCLAQRRKKRLRWWNCSRSTRRHLLRPYFWPVFN